MNSTNECFILPEPSTSSLSGVWLEFLGADLTLRFDYDRNGSAYNSGLVFKKVRAHKYVAETHCPAWKIEMAYDKLVELNQSDFIQDILQNTDPRDLQDMNHYMIYFDGDGCFEIASESWSELPEMSGALSK